jgi:hypothetical protein
VVLTWALCECRAESRTQAGLKPQGLSA